MTNTYAYIDILKQDKATSTSLYSHFMKSQKEVYFLAQAQSILYWTAESVRCKEPVQNAIQKVEKYIAFINYFDEFLINACFYCRFADSASQKCPNDPLLSVSWQSSTSSLKRFDSKERFVNVANFFKAENSLVQVDRLR